MRHTAQYTQQLVIDSEMLITKSGLNFDNIISLNRRSTSTLIHIACRDRKVLKALTTIFGDKPHIKLHAASETVEAAGYQENFDIDEHIYVESKFTYHTATEWTVEAIDHEAMLISNKDGTVHQSHVTFIDNQSHFFQITNHADTPYNTLSLMLPSSFKKPDTQIHRSPAPSSLTANMQLVEIRQDDWIITRLSKDSVTVQKADLSSEPLNITYQQFRKDIEYCTVNRADCHNLAAILHLPSIQKDLPTHILSNHADQMVYLYEQLQPHIASELKEINNILLPIAEARQHAMISEWLTLSLRDGIAKAGIQMLTQGRIEPTTFLELNVELLIIMINTVSHQLKIDEHANPYYRTVQLDMVGTCSPYALNLFMQIHPQYSKSMLATRLLKHAPSTEMRALYAKRQHATPLFAKCVDKISLQTAATSPNSTTSHHHAHLFKLTQTHQESRQNQLNHHSIS